MCTATFFFPYFCSMGVCSTDFVRKTENTRHAPPSVLFNYFVYTLFKQVPMATFPRLSSFADVRSPSRWRPTHSRPQSRLANFTFHQCASPFSFFSITWLSIGHASMSACLYTWSQNPLSLVLFAPPLSCFGTITLHSCAA